MTAVWLAGLVAAFVAGAWSARRSQAASDAKMRATIRQIGAAFAAERRPDDPGPRFDPTA